MDPILTLFCCMNAGRPFPSVTRRPLGLTSCAGLMTMSLACVCPMRQLPSVTPRQFHQGQHSFLRVFLKQLWPSVAHVVSDSENHHGCSQEGVPLVPVLFMGSQASEGDLALWVFVGYPSMVQERIHQEGTAVSGRCFCHPGEAGVAFSVLLSWGWRVRLPISPLFLLSQKSCALGSSGSFCRQP